MPAARTRRNEFFTSTGGRPTGRDFHAHHRAKLRRCHAITVPGWTIARHSAHRDRRRETMTQNARSIGRSRGRGVARRRIANCWRSTRFSANRFARGRSAANSAPTTASRIAFMTADHRPVHRRRHHRIGTLVRVRSPRAHLVDSPHNRVDNEFLDSTVRSPRAHLVDSPHNRVDNEFLDSTTVINR